MALEQYIKNKFENFRPTPPESVWQNIQLKIHKPWYRQLWVKIALAIVVVSSLTISALKITSHHNKKQIKVITINNPQLNIPIERNPTEEEQQNYNSNNKVITFRTDKNNLHNNNIPTDSIENEPYTNEAKDINKTHIDSFITPSDKRNFNFKIFITPHQGCSPLKVKMRVLPPENMNVSWFVDKNLISNSSYAEYTLSEGSHFIQLALFDEHQTILIYDTIIVYPTPHAEFDAEKSMIGDTLLIKNLSVNATSYQWNLGDGKIEKTCTPIHVYRQPGLYNITLIAANEHCSDTISKTITVKSKDAAIIFPNAFVPDINGPNGGYYNPNKPIAKVFHPVIKKPVKEYKLQIFDRRGKLIFESNDINRGWDGYYRNKLVPIGVYIYLAQGTFEDGENFTVKGDITVIYRR